MARKLLAFVVFGMALALGGMKAATGAPGSDASSRKVAAARRETGILSAFRADARLRAYDITVIVDGNRAVLGGSVDSAAARTLAASSAARTPGIRHVENHIRVDPLAVSPVRSGAARGADTIIADATISASVRSRLSWNTHTEGLDIRIDTRHGKVTLAGSAISYAERDIAGRVAANTTGVLDVDNELALTKQSRPAAAARSDDPASGKEPSDPWITSRVRSSLMLTRGVSGSGIEVATRRGVVSLSGIVATKADREVAVQVAQDTRGVKDVDAEGLTSG